MHQVITANRLSDGAVVFLGRERAWVDRLSEAEVFSTVEASAAALADAGKDEQANVILDLYAVDVAPKDGAMTPVKLREAIRAQGPTVKPEHGKPR